jgi:hypothetical protein
MCDHIVCAKLRYCGAPDKCGVVTVVTLGASCVILGRVGLGPRFNALTTCCGGYNVRDKCWLDTAYRELAEEYKLVAPAIRVKCVMMVHCKACIRIIIVFDATGCHFPDIRNRVLNDYNTALNVLELKLPNGETDVRKCHAMHAVANEPIEHTIAATNGELMDIFIMHANALRNVKRALPPFQFESIEMAVNWRLHQDKIVWSR